ncbi:MAG: SdpI family protein [Bacteroidia bacterium]|nr:SdpI family protein [Bacteroidia bacterium]
MNEYLIICVICGLSFFSLGLKLNRDPGSMDTYWGYRTRSSRRNEDTWYEGNVYAGRCLMVFASIILMFVVLTEVYFYNNHLLFFVLAALILFAVVLIYAMTERHLKRLFFRDGKRRPRF